MTVPIGVSEPLGATRNASTAPLPPVWAYRTAPFELGVASTVPGPVAVFATNDRSPRVEASTCVNEALPAFDE